MVIQTLKNCAMASICCDPCGSLSKSFWDHIAEMSPGTPNPSPPLYDQCKFLGECKLALGSRRCRELRCENCKLWHNKKAEFIGAPSEVLYDCHIKDKILVGIDWKEHFRKMYDEIGSE